jgi:uncharacterized protein (UPF0276 family)
MSIALFCNPSPGLAALYQARQVSLDGIECTSFNAPSQIERMHADYTGLRFQFHASNLGRTLFSQFRLKRYQQVCPDSPWVSIHFSPVPSWAVFPALKFGLRLPLPASERMEKRFARKVVRLKTALSLPVILENMPVDRVLNTLMESAPGMIRDVLNEVDIDMLLDLAHARVAADFRQMPVEEYLLQLPLHRVRQIHLSGVRRVDGKLQDAHETLVEEDYRLLSWALTRTKPDVVTLEYFKADQEALREMLTRLRQVLDVSGGSE